MSAVGTIRDEWRRAWGISKEIKAEDRPRSLAVNERRGYRLPTLYANNDFLLTKTGAWAGYLVPPKIYGFLNESARRDYFKQSDAIFSRIFPADKGSAGHILVTNRVHSADEWRESLAERYVDTANPAFADYVAASADKIEQTEFFDRDCYLFTRLGSRGERGGVRGTARSAFEFMALGVGMDDSQPDEDERAFWRTQSAANTDTLSTSWLRADPVPLRLLEWLTRHLDTPALPTPDLSPADAQSWGDGDWRTVLASYTEEIDLGQVGKNRYRAVEFSAPVGEGKAYAAYLPISRVPNDLHYGQNWIHHATSLNFPVDASVHFEIIDPDRAEKALERPISDADGQEAEDQEAGVRADDVTTYQGHELRAVKARVQMGREPLAYWQAVLCVYDTDKKELLSKITRLVKHYRDIHFELVCPRDDQRALFYQTFPGAEVTVGDWTHRTDTRYLASAQPWLASSMGDGRGLYQGHTIVRDANGTQQRGVPVLYDLQNVADIVGKTPTEAITGYPGSGKALAVTELIATINGWVAMGDIKVGDTVFDEQGKPCSVTFATEHMLDHDVYDVKFDDGTVIRADADHRWTTETREARVCARTSRRACADQLNGSVEFRDHLAHLIQVSDPEDTITSALLQGEIEAALTLGRELPPEGADSVGAPNRATYQQLGRGLSEVSTYTEASRDGGGRRSALYSKVDFCKALLTWAEGVLADQRVLPQTRTTAQILGTLTVDGDRPNHSIPVTDPVQYPDRSLPLDPYLLGAWLGAGRGDGSGAFTTEDSEIVEAFEGAGFGVQMVEDRGSCKDYYVSGLSTALRALGVVGDKHIPDGYTLTSVDQRLALLQGLMDTAGSVDAAGSCEFYQSDEQVARQVRSLVASLGMKSALRREQGGYRNGDGVMVQPETAFTVSFAPNTKVARLQRKAERLNLTTRQSTAERRYIVAVDAVQSEPVKCITVDSPSNLFLATDAYVPTHNTVSRGLFVVHQDCLRGVTQFVWDPKGDFLPLALYADEMMLDPSKVKLVNLLDPNSSVSMDAMALAEVDPEKEIDDRQSAAFEVFSQLCAKQVGAEGAMGLLYEEIIRLAVRSVLEEEKAGGATATMKGARAKITAWANEDFTGINIGEGQKSDWSGQSRNLDSHLRAITESTLGRLLFRDPAESGSIKIAEGDLVIFVALGMQPTEPGEKPTEKTVVADAISGLMTDFIRSLLFVLPDTVVKSLVFDEWHVIKRTPRAAALVDWLRRMGRSKRCMVRQMSQSATDFDKSSLSTVWAGYCQDDEAAHASCDLLGIEPSAANVSLLKNLPAGQFLVRDDSGAVAHVAVDIWDPWLLGKFNTQAVAKEEMAKLASMAT